MTTSKKTVKTDAAAINPEDFASDKDVIRKIVVLPRGWVTAGIWHPKVEKMVVDGEELINHYIELRSSYVVRRWGTNAGLGQLAMFGRQSETILDALPTIQVPYQSVVFTLDCPHDEWSELSLAFDDDDEPHKALEEDIRIVVLPRGWVQVGKFIPKTETLFMADGTPYKNHYVELSGGYVVRRWGTSTGLGQLAIDGPQSETTLDPLPATQVPLDSVVFSIPCCHPSWLDLCGTPHEVKAAAELSKKSKKK
jgi:hypothetical protein